MKAWDIQVRKCRGNKFHDHKIKLKKGTSHIFAFKDLLNQNELCDVAEMQNVQIRNLNALFEFGLIEYLPLLTFLLDKDKQMNLHIGTWGMKE